MAARPITIRGCSPKLTPCFQVKLRLLQRAAKLQEPRRRLGQRPSCRQQGGSGAYRAKVGAQALAVARCVRVERVGERHARVRRPRGDEPPSLRPRVPRRDRRESDRASAVRRAGLPRKWLRNLLLLLDCRSDLLGVLAIIRQSQPRLRHVG